MNLKFEELKCPNCEDELMHSAGANIGGRVTTVRFRCPECQQVILIIPVRNDLEYRISATTSEERREEYIKKKTLEHKEQLDKIIEDANKMEF